MRRTPFSARAGTERLAPLTLTGLALVPLIVAGVLAWALWAPGQNLDRVTAAIVNDDAPVTVNGQTVPLGRQFAGALMSGGSATVSGGEASATPAPTGTSAPTGTPTPSPTPIPAEAPPAADPHNFDWVLTNDAEAGDGLTSGRYAAVVTIPSSFSANALSFSGPAAQAKQASITVRTGAAVALLDPALTAAITQTATAALGRQLTVQYLGNVYQGFNTINTQIGGAASGAASLASGADTLAQGTQQLAAGAASLATGAQSVDAGAQSLASGLSALSDQTASLPAQSAQLARGATAVAGATDAAAARVSAATASLTQAQAQVCPGPGCAAVTDALTTLQQANADVGTLATVADGVATGNQQLAAALPQVVDGIDQSATGAAQLASGTAQTSSGAASLSSGAASSAAGAAQVDAGAQQLSSGLATAVTDIPTYSPSDIATLTAVVAQPVVATQKAPPAGVATVPLFLVLALWVGAMATAYARRAVPDRELMTTTPSLTITLRAAGVTALVGAGEGVLAAALAQLWLGLRPDVWLEFALAGALVGAVFCLINQALAAAFGGVGRLLALVVGLLALVSGMSSTVPPAVASLAAAMPTAPASSGLRAITSGDAGGAWGDVGLLLLCAVGALALLFAAVAARRSVRLTDLAPRSHPRAPLAPPPPPTPPPAHSRAA
ncbi:YhgE/Pip domain-containing protein [Leifsonia aquatica]|uniref:YhgE/Pip domain-containing protein n=1 Tax=Leifsonia aquatica TaxID=144185 RepID=UPI00381652F3